MISLAVLRHRLPAITSFSFPFYDQLRFYVPSLIDTLVWGWSERITHVELATPGPMGLVGLMLAKDQSEMGVRCAVAQFTAKDGVLSSRFLLP